MDLDALTLTAAVQKLRQKEFSSVELTTAILERTEKENQALNAYVNTYHTSALAAARRADRALASGDPPALTGIPIAVKDNILLQGKRTTAGSRILESYDAAYNATVIDRLNAAGAVVVGKTNLDEFAMGSSGEHSAYGPTKNPWDTERVPGGSSSGSAVAVAAGLALGALGSDTAGSVRTPAGFTNLVGLKPTYGRVSRYGLIALGSSLDVIGTLTRTAADALAVYSAIAGQDSRDGTTTSAPVDAEVGETTSLTGLRIGIPEDLNADGMDPRIEGVFHDAVSSLKELGVEIRTVKLPDPRHALAAYYVILPAEVSTNLERYDGIRYAPPLDHDEAETDLHEHYVRYRTRGFGPEVKRRLMLGTYVLSHGYHDQYYTKAQKVRTAIRDGYTKLFQEVDCVITPTSPTVPFRLGEKNANPLSMYLSDIFTCSANIAGLPAVSMPAGFVDGLPVGVQLMGPQLHETTLLRVAQAYEGVTDWTTRRPTRS